LLAFLHDAARLRLGVRIPIRVLHRLRPSRTAAIEAGAVTQRVGDWPGSGQRSKGPDPDTVGGAPAVVAFEGPVAVPGRWFAEHSMSAAAAGVPAPVGLPTTFAGAIAIDEYVAPGPAAKQGEMLRGRARRVRGRPGVLAVELDRRVTWDGV